jgi:hypothetical protein
MKFLDRKEQVLELHLTQYGKSLLSRGKFKPTHYAFFDDDVVYDSKYMSTGGDTDTNPLSLEAPTTTSDRIRKAIRPQVQHNYAGAETNMNRVQTEYEFVTVQDMQPGVDEDGYAILVPSGPEYLTVGSLEQLSDSDVLQALEKPPPTIDNYYSMGLPMGTSGYNSSKSPATKVILNSGEITEPVTFYTGSSGLLKIPQLNIKAFYDVYIKSAPTPQETQNNVDIHEFAAGSYIKIEKESVLLDISEFNSVFEAENYDIEVFEVSEEIEFVGSTIGYQENLKPLNFMQKEQTQDSLYDTSAAESSATATTNDVEYYLDISVDGEIADNIDLASSANVYDTPPNNEEPC